MLYYLHAVLPMVIMVLIYISSNDKNHRVQKFHLQFHIYTKTQFGHYAMQIPQKDLTQSETFPSQKSSFQPAQSTACSAVHRLLNVRYSFSTPAEFTAPFDQFSWNTGKTKIQMFKYTNTFQRIYPIMGWFEKADIAFAPVDMKWRVQEWWRVFTWAVFQCLLRMIM